MATGTAQPPRSTCLSGSPGAMWWDETRTETVQGPDSWSVATTRAVPVRVWTQWDAVVRKFQASANDLLSAAYPDDAARRGPTVAVDGSYGAKTRAKLVSCLNASGLAHASLLLGAGRDVTDAEVAYVLFFALHVTMLTRTAFLSADRMTIGDVSLPDDMALPTLGARVRSNAADAEWVAVAARDQPRPPAPSERAAALPPGTTPPPTPSRVPATQPARPGAAAPSQKSTAEKVGAAAVAAGVLLAGFLVYRELRE